MTQVALNGMPGYPGAPGALIAITGGEYFHGIQNQSGTWVDCSIPLSKYQNALNVLGFPGVDPTGATDSTSGMQAAHNTGRVIYYPGGTYKFSTLTMSAGGIVGDGESYSYLASTDTGGGNTILFSATNAMPGANAPIFRDFTLTGQSSKSGGTGLYVTAPSGENAGGQFARFTIYNFPNTMGFGAASTWAIQNCRFINYSVSGIVVANSNNPDSGDSVIMGCNFGTSVGATPVAINYQSSGGLKVIGNKMNGGSYGFYLGLTASASTSDLLMSGNSIENQAVCAIELSRASGSASFSNIIIVGNQLAINPNGIATDASGAIGNLIIEGNTIDLSSTTTGSGISLANINTFYVGGNTIVGNGGTPGGIAIASSCSNGKIGKNSYPGITVTLQNNSTTTFYERDKQVGTTSVTTSAAYGSLFVGALSVTFPTAFTVAPEVTCAITSTSTGGIQAFPSSVTKTGFTMSVIGLTNSVAVATAWQAEGVI